MTAAGAAPVDVVVVAYRHPDKLAACLDTLGDGHRIVVVDNDPDRAGEAVARRAGATYLPNDRNVGFAAAVNQALEHLSPIERDVFLLNPDARIDGSALAELHRWLHQPGNERLAAVAPCQFGDGGMQRIEWPFPTPGAVWADNVGLGRRRPRPCFIVGSALLVRATALRDVGRFDERFFLYAEETDWQWRAHRRGWQVAVCHAVMAFHEGGGTSSDDRRREVLFHSSAEAFMRKWHGTAGWTSARVATVAGALGRAAVRRGEDRRAALRRAALYVRGPGRVAQQP